MAFKSSSVINLVIRQPKKDTNTVYYFRDPTNVGWFFSFSLPPSADFSYVNIVSTSGKQDILKQSEANTDLLYFSRQQQVWIFETLLARSLLSQIARYLCSIRWNKFPYICYRILACMRNIVLTCLDNINDMVQVCKKSSKSHQSQWREAGPILFQLKSFLPFSLFLFVSRPASTTTKSSIQTSPLQGISTV